MDQVLLNSILTLSGIAILASSILFIAAKKFQVEEDPRIQDIDEVLPGANCGACGFPGCRNFADAVVKRGHVGNAFCPVGGNETMKKVGAIMGETVAEQDPLIAVVRCQGSREKAPKKINYLAARSCALSHMTFSGEKGCPNSCLGLGDCVFVCLFDAIKVNEQTGLPEVDKEKCTACGACVTACPRRIIELRPKKDKMVYIACMNREKGAFAKKNCQVACIGCSKCVKVATELQGEAAGSQVESFLAYLSPAIDAEKFGAKIVTACPTKSVVGIGLENEVAQIREEEKKARLEKAKAMKESDALKGKE